MIYTQFEDFHCSVLFLSSVVIPLLFCPPPLLPLYFLSSSSFLALPLLIPFPSLSLISLPLPLSSSISTSSPNHHIHSNLSLICLYHGYHSSMRNYCRRYRLSFASLSSSPVRCSIRGIYVGPRIKTSHISISPSSTSTLRTMEPSRCSSTDHFYFNKPLLYQFHCFYVPC
jgi:hypothetical protein